MRELLEVASGTALSWVWPSPRARVSRDDVAALNELGVRLCDVTEERHLEAIARRTEIAINDLNDLWAAQSKKLAGYSSGIIISAAWAGLEVAGVTVSGDGGPVSWKGKVAALVVAASLVRAIRLSFLARGARATVTVNSDVLVESTRSIAWVEPQERAVAVASSDAASRGYDHTQVVRRLLAQRLHEHDVLVATYNDRVGDMRRVEHAALQFFLVLGAAVLSSIITS